MARRGVIDRGAVVLVTLDPTAGHEQRGTRPCVVMSSTEVTRHQRFALMAVVPLTGVASGGALYPRVMPGDSGLRKVSFALTDQVRSVDKRRIVRVFGEIRDEELAAIEEGLRLFLGLS